MRNLLFILIIVQTLVGCEEKITDAFAYTGVLEISESELSFNSGKYSKTLEIKGVIDWDVDTSSIEPWCDVLVIRNFNGREHLTLSVEANKSADNRKTQIKVFSGAQEKVVEITQLGSYPQIKFSPDSLVIGVDTNRLEINLVSNVDYEMSTNGDWYQVKDVDHEGDRRLLIGVSTNNTGAERNGVITFKNKNGLEEWAFEFKQLTTKVPYFPNGENELVPNQKVNPVSATASSESEGKEIEKSYDGNSITRYQSVFQNLSEPVILEYHFDGTTPIHYVNYIPYETESDKSFKSTKIWVKEEGDEEYTLRESVTYNKTGEQLVVLNPALEKPISIKFEVKTSYTTEKGLVVAACAEMEFYSATARYANIFADPIYGTLKPDVTLEDIFDIKDLTFRNIAYSLYHNSYDDGRILNCSSYPTLEAGYKTFRGAYGNKDNATGIVVKEGDVLPIFANNIGADMVYAIIYNPENLIRKRERLLDGVNKFTAQTDGHLYIEFESSEVKNIDIHVAGGMYNGIYDVSKSTDYDLLDITKSPYIDLLGKHAHLIFKKQSLKDLQESNITLLIDKYDKIVRSQQLFIGLEKYGEEFSNRVLFLESSNNLVTVYENGCVKCPEVDMSKLGKADEIKGDILWGLAYAVGHIHNHKNLAFTGYKNISPQLLALATQQAFDEPLEIDKNNWYTTAFRSIIVPEIQLEKSPDNSYLNPEKIVPFWQLELYAREVLGKDEFYMDVFDKFRGGSQFSNMDFDPFTFNIIQEVLELDLTDFRTKWNFRVLQGQGMMNPEGYPNQPPVTLPYITPNNIEVFKNGGGAPSADGYKVNRYSNAIGVINPQNVVVYFVRHTFHPMQIFDTQNFKAKEWTDSMRIYAVGLDGTEVELPRL